METPRNVLCVVLQSSFSLDMTLWQGRGPIRSVEASLGTLGTFLYGPAGESGSLSDFHGGYEQDAWAGACLGRAGGWRAGIGWQGFASPSDAFSFAQELDLVLEREEEDLQGLWRGLAPRLTLALEVQGQSGLGDVRGVDIELAARPRLALDPRSEESLLLGFPLTWD